MQYGDIKRFEVKQTKLIKINYLNNWGFATSLHWMDL